MKRTKSFDAVKSMRRIRNRLGREIEGMTWAEEVEYFRRKTAESVAGRKGPKKQDSYPMHIPKSDV